MARYSPQVRPCDGVTLYILYHDVWRMEMYAGSHNTYFDEKFNNETLLLIRYFLYIQY